jgi:hypothetical protein
MKTFTVAGTSVENGVTKFRVANDLAGRIKMLERCENTDIVLDELPEPMTKQAAAQYVLDNNLCSEDAEAAVAAVAQAAPKAPAAKKVAKAPAAKPVSDDAIAKLVEEKRMFFPSFTDAQLLEVVTFQVNANMKAFRELEPTF